jgi:hypothetical protein
VPRRSSHGFSSPGAGSRTPPSIAFSWGVSTSATITSLDGYARNPDDQIGVSLQQAVLRVCVATRTDPAVKTYGPRWLAVLEGVARLYLFELNLHESRKSAGRFAVDPRDITDDLFFLFLRKRPNQSDAR